MLRSSIVTALASLAVAGCSSVASTSIRTSGISATITVTADGSGTATVVAALRVGDSSTEYVQLASGDMLVASEGAASSQMSPASLLGAVSYGAAFTDAGTEGTAFTVALDRANDTSAPKSTCSLPAPFDVAAPASASASRAHDLQIVWTPSGKAGAMTYDVSGSCIEGLYRQAVSDDGGSLTIEPNALRPSSTTGASTSCLITITVRRSLIGTLDGAFGYGGSITCEQDRTMTVTSTP